MITKAIPILLKLGDENLRVQRLSDNLVGIELRSTMTES